MHFPERLEDTPFHKKILRIGRAGKKVFFESAILNFFFKKKKMCHIKQPIHMRYNFFLHYGWFLQNLGKEAVRTNMHTNVFILAIQTLSFLNVCKS